jgi:hypothetical protein
MSIGRLLYVKGCSRIDLIRLGEHAVYNNLAKRKLLIVRFGFCGNRARASRDPGRASARYNIIKLEERKTLLYSPIYPFLRAKLKEL